MYVCSCRGVTDRTVTTAIATGARTIEEIASRCGAGARNDLYLAQQIRD